VSTTSVAPALRLSGVSRRFGGLVAVRDVTLDVARGERHVILGPNGAGKTTLFNLVTGDIPVSTGSIEIDGTPVTGMRPHRRAALGLARTYQRSTLFGGLGVADNLRLGLLGRRGPRFSMLRQRAAALDPDVARIADEVGLPVRTAGDDAPGAVLPGRLSHGQQRQLEVGIALATDPSLLLLDEPAAGLSPAERGLLSKLLDELPRDLTIILIEHDMDVALPFADRVTVMHDGAVVEAGTPSEVVASHVVQEIYLGGRHA
jgi:branched-chain amino acid transport system ATP-binding protein